MKKIVAVIKNDEGLHAKPANVFSKTALKFESKIKVFKNGNEEKAYDPKRIISVLSMGCVKGDSLTIIAEGIDEAEAVSTLKALIDAGIVSE